jgi:hypothetical protein
MLYDILEYKQSSMLLCPQKQNNQISVNDLPLNSSEKALNQPILFYLLYHQQNNYKST